MQYSARILRLSALVLLCSCGGGGGEEETGRRTSGPPPQELNVAAGNWQFSTVSTVSGMPSATIAGNINQSGSLVNGSVHVDGSNCFDQLTTIGLAGTVTGSSISLTSTSINGQLIDFNGTIDSNALNGTYAINGGCANGDQGTVTGLKIPSFSGTWRSGFEINDQHFYGLAMVTQASASPEGSFGLTGTIEDSDPVSCLSGTIQPGTFPTRSFIMGSSVALEIETGDGTVVFLGTMNQDGSEIIGSHHIVGGKCGGFLGGGCFGRDSRSLCRLP